MGAEARANPFNKWRNAAADGISQFKVYDAYGRELALDDLLLWPTKPVVEWRVREVRPSLRPDQPGLTLTLMALAQIVVPGGTPMLDLVKILDAAQVRERLKLPEEPPAEEPQPEPQP